MASSGAESVRAAFYWHQIQPNGPDDRNFAVTDAIVLAAAQRGLAVLPVVHHTPELGGAELQAIRPRRRRTLMTLPAY